MSDVPEFEGERRLARREREDGVQRWQAEVTFVYLCGALRFFGVEKVVAPFHEYDSESCYGPWVGEVACHPPLPDLLPFGLADRIRQLLEPFIPGGVSSNDCSWGTFTLDVASAMLTVDFDFPNEAGE